MERKYEDMRSCWEFGEASECRRGLMLGMGLSLIHIFPGRAESAGETRSVGKIAAGELFRQAE